MANPVNIFNFATEDLAAFLAKPVSDGTYADVFGTLKVDQAGEEASATEIQQYAGQLLGNGVDDFIQAAYPYIRQISLGVGSAPNRKDIIPGELVPGVDQALATPLSVPPLPDSLTLFLNGIEQVEGDDYTLAGVTITWLAGTGTAVPLDTSDELTAYYQG